MVAGIDVVSAEHMDQAAITRFVETTLPGVDTVIGAREIGSPELAWGDTFFIYDPERTLVDGLERYDRSHAT